MLNPSVSEPELLKAVLQPLLEDFQFWFGRTRRLLETEEVNVLEAQEQAQLLARIQQTQKEVSSAQALLNATGGKAGIETSILVPWHQLVLECWQVGMTVQHRSTSSQS